MSKTTGPARRGDRTMHAQLVNELGRRIVSGSFVVGSKLPVEDELAAELDVSKGAVREVVKALVAKGLLSPRPRTGTLVNPREEWNLLDPQVLEWHTGNERHGESLSQQLIELRLLVEPPAAQLAARRADSEHLDQVVDACRLMQEAARTGDTEGFVSADVRFHQAVLKSSGNEMIAQLARLFHDPMRAGIKSSAAIEGEIARAIPLHAAVADAMVSRQPELARQCSETLLITTLESLHRGEPVELHRTGQEEDA